MSAGPIRLRQQTQAIRLPQRGPRDQLGGEPLTHRGQAHLALALQGQGPAVQDRAPGHPLHKPLFRRQGHRGFRPLVRRQHLAAALMHSGRNDQRLYQAQGERHLLRQGARRLAVLQGLLRKAHVPQLPGQMAVRRHAEVNAVAHRQGPVRLRVMERQGLRVVGLGHGRLAPIEQDRPQLKVGEQAQRRVGLGLGQVEQLLPEWTPL